MRLVSTFSLRKKKIELHVKQFFAFILKPQLLFYKYIRLIVKTKKDVEIDQ